MTFQELGISEPILKAIGELGFQSPMPVQEQAIPHLLQNGGDVVVLAQTGTGKTAAYGLPLIQHTDVASPDAQALILSPTRELCMQIASDLADFSKYIDGLHIIPMYGGTSIENQIRNFRRGAHIIVATPGRLCDLMDRGVVKLETIRTLILDEADEMLNMGFSEDLEKIVSQTPEGRQTMMFSATMSREIQGISKKYLRNAKEIVVGTRNEGAENVDHIYYMVHAKDKYLALKRIVDFYPNIYAIIFCRTRMETQEVADKLIQDGYNADSLHGELSQAQRDMTMQKFRYRQLQLLVATDVAARGLDVDDLTHVINYGLPDDTENYTHRSGRTGRAGKTGTSISIINLREKGKVRIIEKAIGKKFVLGEMPSGEKICEKQLYKVMDDIERIQVDEEQIAPFLPDIMRKLDWLDKEDIIKRVVSREFSRFARYYADAPELEDISDQKAPDPKREKKRHAQEGFTRLFINVGKMDGLRPTHIMEMTNKWLHGPRVDIGRIDVMRNFSFFEVNEADAQQVIDALDGKEYKGRQLTVQVASESEAHKSGRKPAQDDGAKPERKERKPRPERQERQPKPERREEKPERRPAPKRESARDRDEKEFRKYFHEEADARPARKEKPARTEKPARSEKPARTEKPAKPVDKDRKKAERRAPKRAPQVSQASAFNDDDFLENDWRQFFRGSEKGKRK